MAGSPGARMAKRAWRRCSASREARSRRSARSSTNPTLAWCNLPDGSEEFLNRRWYLSQDIREKHVLPLAFGDARYAPIAAEDQGRVVAAILNNPGEHAGKIYGPRELSQHETADILTQVLGQTITCVRAHPPNRSRTRQKAFAGCSLCQQDAYNLPTSEPGAFFCCRPARRWQTAKSDGLAPQSDRYCT